MCVCVCVCVFVCTRKGSYWIIEKSSQCKLGGPRLDKFNCQNHFYFKLFNLLKKFILA